MTLIATPCQSTRLAWDRILAEFPAVVAGSRASHLFGRALALFSFMRRGKLVALASHPQGESRVDRRMPQ